MPFTINDMRSQLVGGGARPSHFQVIITNPINGAADLKVPFMVKAASVPAFTLGKVEVPYFGRKIPYAGDRVWEDWQTTVINDEDHLVRNALESWSNAINAFQRNISTVGVNPGAYKSQAQITKFSKDGQATRIYQLNDVWPMQIGAIDNNWETTDTIEEFPVIWAYTDCQIVGGSTGDGGGQ